MHNSFKIISFWNNDLGLRYSCSSCRQWLSPRGTLTGFWLTCGYGGLPAGTLCRGGWLRNSAGCYGWKLEDFVADIDDGISLGGSSGSFAADECPALSAFCWANSAVAECAFVAAVLDILDILDIPVVDVDVDVVVADVVDVDDIEFSIDDFYAPLPRYFDGGHVQDLISSPSSWAYSVQSLLIAHNFWQHSSDLQWRPSAVVGSHYCPELHCRYF